MFALLEKMVLGKSTLAKLIAGIIKPSYGRVLVDEKDTKKKDNFLEIRKKIGIVFQNPDNQIIFNRVEDEMKFALDNLKLEGQAERIRRSITKSRTSWKRKRRSI